VISIKTPTNDPAISGVTHESPVVMMVHDEKAQPPNPKCYTSAFNGYVIPLFRADALTTITVIPSRKYSTDVNVTAASNLFEAASAASLAFTGAPLGLQIFNAADLQAKAATVDAKLGAGCWQATMPPAGLTKSAILMRQFSKPGSL